MFRKIIANPAKSLHNDGTRPPLGPIRRSLAKDLPLNSSKTKTSSHNKQQLIDLFNQKENYRNITLAESEIRKAAELTISAQQQQLLEKDITILEERRAKEASDAKAEEARAKAEEASAKAEKLAAYLRTHGIDPDTL